MKTRWFGLAANKNESGCYKKPTVRIYQMTFVTLNGRLGFDPKKVVRKTANGDVEVLELRVICNPFVGGVSYTNFFNVTVWPGRFENIVKNLGKGSAVMIIGVLYIVEYTDKNGNPRTANNVNLMSLSFPVADSEEAFKKRKKPVKKPGTFYDDNAAVVMEPDSGVVNEANKTGDDEET